MTNFSLAISAMRKFEEIVENSFRSQEPALIERMLSKLRSQLAVEPRPSEGQAPRELMQPALEEKEKK